MKQIHTMLAYNCHECRDPALVKGLRQIIDGSSVELLCFFLFSKKKKRSWHEYWFSKWDLLCTSVFATQKTDLEAACREIWRSIFFPITDSLVNLICCLISGLWPTCLLESALVFFIMQVHVILNYSLQWGKLCPLQQSGRFWPLGA